MKSCDAKYNLRRTENIQLGTLEYYRKHTSEEVGDAAEASLYTDVKIDEPMDVPAEIIGKINPGGVGISKNFDNIVLRPSRTFAKSVVGSAIDRKKRFYRIDELDIRYETWGSDALIFCMTQADSISDPPVMGYESNWFLRKSAADRFAENLLVFLNEELLDSPQKFLQNPLIVGATKALPPKFELKHGPVKYRPRNVTLRNPSLRELNDLAWDLRNADFVKEDKYRHQREYRFCFRLTQGRRILKMNKGLESFQIPAERFKRYAMPRRIGS